MGTLSGGKYGTLVNNLLGHWSFDGNFDDLSGGGAGMVFQMENYVWGPDKDGEGGKAIYATGVTLMKSDLPLIQGDAYISVWAYRKYYSHILLSNFGGKMNTLKVADNSPAGFNISDFYDIALQPTADEGWAHFVLQYDHNATSIDAYKDGIYLGSFATRSDGDVADKSFVQIYGYGASVDPTPFCDELRVGSRMLSGKPAGVGQAATGEIAELFEMGVNYTQTQLAVIFETNGATTQVNPVNVDSGGTISEPVGVVRPLYDLFGWYTDAQFNNKFNFGINTITANTTLYAKWLQKEEEMSSKFTFLEKSTLTESGSIGIVDKRDASDYVVGKKQKLVIAANMPKSMLSSVSGKFCLDTLTGVNEISAMINVIKAAISTSGDVALSFELFYLQKALEKCTADSVDIIYTVDDEFAPINAIDMKAVVRYSFIDSLDYFGVVVSAFKDGKNIYDVLDKSYFKSKISERFLGYMVKLNFNPFGSEEFDAATFTFARLASISGEIPGVVSTDALKKYGFTPSPQLLTRISNGTETSRLIDKATFFGKTCDDALYVNLAKKIAKQEAVNSEEESVGDKVKNVTVFMPSILLTKKELETINFGSKELPYYLMVDGKTAAEYQVSYNKAKLDAFAFASDGATQKPWDRLVMNVADGQFVSIDDKAVSVYAATLARTLKADELKAKYYENRRLDADLSIPGWDIWGRIISNTTKQPSMDAYMNDMAIAGSLNNVDMTDVVVGANFSYELGTTIRSIYESNEVNSGSVATGMRLLLNAALNRLFDNNILSKDSEVSIDINEYHGTFNIAVKAIDRDTNKEYNVTLDLTRTPSVEKLGQNVGGAQSVQSGNEQ